MKPDKPSINRLPEDYHTLSASHKRMHLAANIAQLGFYEWDIPTDTAVWENDRIYELFGYDSDEKPLSKANLYKRHLHPEDREQFEQSISEALASGGLFYITCRIYPKNSKELRWLEYHGEVELDSDGQALRMTGVVRDITKEKQQEEALRKQRMQYQLLVENLPDVVFHIDKELRHRYISPQVEAATGIPPEAWLGKTGLEAGMPADIYQAFAEKCRDTLSTETINSMEFEYDGEVYRTRIIPERDQNGDIQAIMGVTENITPQKKAEQALLEISRRKDAFLATLAHELRNPLSPVKAALEVLQQNPHPAAGRQAREIISRQVRTLSRLIDDLMDISRIERDKISLKKERISLQQVIKEATETVRPLIIAKSHRIKMQVPDKPLHIHADQVRMTQVVTNLLTNAVKYTPEGGQVSVLAKGEAGQATVSIIDNGIGIPEEEQEAVFELFRQSDNHSDGLGVGLSLCEKLVKLHEGQISVHSEGRNKGSEFRITFPLHHPDKESPPATLSQPPRQSGQQLQKKRLLIVDDNHDVARIMAMALKQKELEIRTARNGRQALKLTVEFEPQAVLLDIGLPDIDGYEVARQLRQRFPSVLLIAHSGWGQPADKEKARAAGFDHHLVKPTSVKDIISLLG